MTDVAPGENGEVFKLQPGTNEVEFTFHDADCPGMGSAAYYLRAVQTDVYGVDEHRPSVAWTSPIFVSWRYGRSNNYTPVTPCRIVDTRNAGGMIGAWSEREFYVHGSGATISAQGGDAGGCPAPAEDPLAAHISMIAVDSIGKGHLQAFPVGAEPGAGLSVNYNAIDTNLSNAGTVKTSTGSGPDITVYSGVSSTHTVVDVLGYYSAYECHLDTDCDDGQYCNGAETCVDGICQNGTDVACDDGIDCTVDSCNESSDVCDYVPDNSFCDDGLFCNGTENCDSGLDCIAGSDPCLGQFCDEGRDTCVDCLNDGDCDDGLYCNRTETCVDDVCQPGSDPCPGEFCDEISDQCVAGCEGDFEPDGDVDGSDLAVFAADVGRSDCDIGDPCEGDFDNNNDVDGSDLAVFAADFGRTDCP